jgi:hypothetical protein
MKLIFLIVAIIGFSISQAQQVKIQQIGNDSVAKNQQSKTYAGCPNSSKKNGSIKSVILPAAFITYGFIALENDGLKQLNNSTKLEIGEDHPTFKTTLDNYLQYAPAFAVYGLNVLGVKGKNNFRDRTMIYGISTMLTAAFVLPLKKITKIQRPDGSADNSFPSGHTTTAFAAAEFLRMEYKDVSPWYGIAGYAVATTTGVLRLYNNKHWVSDVVAGAGFGILSTKLAYWIYPSIKRKFFGDKSINTMVLPYYQSGGGGLAFVYKFRH